MIGKVDQYNIVKVRLAMHVLFLTPWKVIRSLEHRFQAFGFGMWDSGLWNREASLRITDLAKICFTATTGSRNSLRNYGRSEDSLGLYICNFVAATQCKFFRSSLWLKNEHTNWVKLQCHLKICVSEHKNLVSVELIRIKFSTIRNKKDSSVFSPVRAVAIWHWPNF